MGGNMIREHHLPKGNKHNTPKQVVVHAMGEFIIDPAPEHAVDFLEKLGLSAHALVAPNGDVWVCRDDDEGAYHARGYNTDSLGIEFLVEGEHDYGSFLAALKTNYITNDQWEAGVKAVKSWVEAYDIPMARVVRHSDISPGRKVDPGAGFDWDQFLDEVFD